VCINHYLVPDFLVIERRVAKPVHEPPRLCAKTAGVGDTRVHVISYYASGNSTSTHRGFSGKPCQLFQSKSISNLQLFTFHFSLFTSKYTCMRNVQSHFIPRYTNHMRLRVVDVYAELYLYCKGDMCLSRHQGAGLQF
jgi:hypothetical protein